MSDQPMLSDSSGLCLSCGRLGRILTLSNRPYDPVDQSHKVQFLWPIGQEVKRKPSETWISRTVTICLTLAQIPKVVRGSAP